MFSLREAFFNEYCSRQIKRKIQSNSQAKKISQFTMDSPARRRKSFGLRQMHQSPGKDEIIAAECSTTAVYTLGVGTIRVQFPALRQTNLSSREVFCFWKTKALPLLHRILGKCSRWVSSCNRQGGDKFGFPKKGIVQILFKSMAGLL